MVRSLAQALHLPTAAIALTLEDMDPGHLLAHELQAPLISLELQLRALREHPPRSDRVERCLNEVRALRSLVTSFLELDAAVKPGALTLASVLERVENRFRPIANARHVRLQIDPTEASAAGDARATERIIANLVDNAIKFSHEEGCVVVRVSRRNGAVEVEVQDEGVGIAPEARARIFEPFYRIDREQPGTGLGLAIARRLAEAQNGYLRLEGARETGSSFVLTLRAM